MRAVGQTRKSAPIGVIARAALRERERQQGIARPSLDFGEHLGPPPEPVPEDERDLELFFRFDQESEGLVGSNYESMLERMGVYLQEPFPCTKCGGVLEVRDGDEVIVSEKRGTGYVRDSEEFKRWQYVETICRRPTDREAIRAWLAKNNEFRAECPACEGIGWRFRWRKDPKRPPTVEVTGKIPKGNPPAKWEDAERLRVLGCIGPRRAALRQADRLAEVALSLYYQGGRKLTALLPLTSWGQRQLRRKPPHVSTRAYFRALKEQGIEHAGVDIITRQLRARAFRGWAEVSAR